MFINNFVSTMMKDLERAVFGVIGTEIDKIGPDELIAAIRHSSIQKPKLGSEIPGSGCRFCAPQAGVMQPDAEQVFECDVKACLVLSITYHTLGILQDADLLVNMTNVTTARKRLIDVLQTVFSERQAKRIAARLMALLEESDSSS